MRGIFIRYWLLRTYFILTFLVVYQKKNSGITSIADVTIIINILAVIITEILSFFRVLSFLPVVISWFIAGLCLMAALLRIKYKQSIIKFPKIRNPVYRPSRIVGYTVDVDCQIELTITYCNIQYSYVTYYSCPKRWKLFVK